MSCSSDSASPTSAAAVPQPIPGGCGAGWTWPRAWSAAGLAAWAVVIGLLLLYALAVSWLAAAVGLLVSSPEAADPFMFVPMIVTYASSAFVPVRTMPSWLHGFASHQPATPVIEALRGLLLGTHVGATGWQALAWCGGVFAGSVALSAAAFRRRSWAR
jgi:ABC-2 type transport system permease protein